MGWFSSDIDTFEELFVHTLQDIYYAEHQILKALPDMVEKATDKKLGGIAKRKINAKAAAKKLRKPTKAEQAENAMLAAAAGIPAI